MSEAWTITIESTDEQIAELFDRMAEDDAFRETLESSPRETLATFGIHYPPELIPDEISLPPKDEIRAALDDMRPTAQKLFHGHWIGGGRLLTPRPLPSE